MVMVVKSGMMTEEDVFFNTYGKGLLELAIRAINDAYTVFENKKDIDVSYNVDMRLPKTTQKAIDIVIEEAKVRYGDDIVCIRNKLKVIREGHIEFEKDKKTYIYKSEQLVEYFKKKEEEHNPVFRFEDSLNFVVTLKFEQFKKYVQQIGNYNDFTPERAIEVIEKVSEMLPPIYYNEGNPNNGQLQFEISIGREGSPVIYLSFNDYLGYMRNILETEGYRDMLERKVAEVSNADEIQFLDPERFDYGTGLPARKYVMRIWWD